MVHVFSLPAGGSVPSFGQPTMPAFGYSAGYDGAQHSQMPRNYSMPTSGFYSHGSMMSPSPLAFSPRTVSPSSATRSPTPGSPKFSRKEPQNAVDLQGVSVKELVKALGKCHILFISDYCNQVIINNGK